MAGAYLAKAGLSVAICERRFEAGGGLATEETPSMARLAQRCPLTKFVEDYDEETIDIELDVSSEGARVPSLLSWQPGDALGERVALAATARGAAGHYPAAPVLDFVVVARRTRPYRLTVPVVRYEFLGRPRKGRATTYLADRVQLNDRIPVFVQPNLWFRLPSEDEGESCIMIGAGCGISAFRSFLQELEERVRSKGASALEQSGGLPHVPFFGRRHEARDAGNHTNHGGKSAAEADAYAIEMGNEGRFQKNV